MRRFISIICLLLGGLFIVGTIDALWVSPPFNFFEKVQAIIYSFIFIYIGYILIKKDIKLIKSLIIEKINSCNDKDKLYKNACISVVLILIIGYVGVSYYKKKEEEKRQIAELKWQQYKEEQREEERKFKEELSTKYPYEGLEEKYINDTILGYPDKVESYRMHNYRQALKTYKWYDVKGEKDVLATVSYWSYQKGDIRVPGYISLIQVREEMIED